jgi:TIR domain
VEKAERLTLIMRIRDALNQQFDEDVELALQTFEIPGGSPWDEVKLTVGERLTRAGDDAVLGLGQYLQVVENKVPMAEGEVASPAQAGSDPAPLFLFGSHISAERKFVGDVRERLGSYGITLFVAHDSIPMDADWEPDIVKALNACQAAVVFLHSGIYDSFYCQQELGWLLGRGVPIARLLAPESPKGLLGKVQGAPIISKTADDTGDFIAQWCQSGKQQVLWSHLATSLVQALRHSPDYATTDLLWPRLTEISELTPSQLELLMEAVESNSQVYDPTYRRLGRGYRRVITDRAAEWDRAGQFTDRIAKVRAASGAVPRLVDEDD